MTDKSTRWQFTAYEEQWRLFQAMPPAVAEWGWNTEICPKTNRKHYQGYFLLRTQHRFAAVKKLFPGVHVEIAKDWNALKEYCKKADTRAPGTEPVVAYNDIPTVYSYSDEVLARLPSWNEVRELWMLHCERQCAITRATTIEQPYYKSCEDFAYEELVKNIIANDIREGRAYIEWIIQNPMWITTFKNQVKNMIIRTNGLTPRFHPPAQTDRQTDTFEVSF